MPFTCPSCKQDTRKLIAINEGQSDSRIGCPYCHIPKPAFSNCRLGQKYDVWYSEKDGTKHTITEGKKWEIDQRVICQEDKKVVVNKSTGKETEY